MGFPSIALNAIPGTFARFAARDPLCVGTVTDGQPLTQCKDLSGNNRDLTPTNAIYRAGRVNGLPSVDLSQSGKLVSANFFPGGDFTLVGVWRFQGDGREVMFDGEGNNFWINGGNATGQTISDMGNTLSCAPHQLSKAGGWHCFVRHAGSGVTFGTAPPNTQMRHTSIDGRCTINNQDGHAPAAGAPLGFGDRGTSVEWAEVAWVTGKLTLTQVAQVQAGASAVYGTDQPTGPVVIVLGNSTSSYYDGLAAPLSLAACAAGLDCRFINLAIPGSTSVPSSNAAAASLQGQQPEIAATAAFFRAAGRQVIHLIHPGHNDWGYNLDTYGYLTSAFWQTLRAAGDKLIWITPTARDEPTADPTRLAQAANMRAHWTQYADALVDAAADPLLGAYPRLPSATGYFADFVHPNQTGLSYLAGLVCPTLVSLVDAPPAVVLDPTIIQKGKTVTVGSVNVTGTYDPITGNYTDPGAPHVDPKVSYVFAGTTIVGTMPAAAAAPTVANILDGFEQRFGPIGDGVAALTGTFDLTTTPGQVVVRDRTGTPRFSYPVGGREAVTVLPGGGS